jgi:hypothetical protein
MWRHFPDYLDRSHQVDLEMSVAQTKAAARRIKQRYPPPRRKRGDNDELFSKKGKKLGGRR